MARTVKKNFGQNSGKPSKMEKGNKPNLRTQLLKNLEEENF